MNTTKDINFAKLIERVALRLLGQPNKGHSTSRQLRFGTNGSISVELDGSGTWYKHEPPETGGGTLDLVIFKTECRTHGEAAAWIKREILRMKDDKPADIGSRDVVEDYEYQDQSGERRYRVTRWSNKSFSQDRWDADTSKWIGGKGCLDRVRKLPYRLSHLLEHFKTYPNDPRFVCEGEKDVNKLIGKFAEYDVAATCNSGGAGNWQSEISHWFKDQFMVILPDNDDAGRRHAQHVASSLYAAGAKAICIIELPGLREKEDVSDWIDSGGTFLELLRLVDEAPNWKPSDNQEPDTAQKDGLITVLASEVKMRPVFWLWDLYIPRAKFSISAGMPKQGKSTVGLSFAAIVSTGGTWPDGSEMHEPANVLIFSSEDDIEDTITPRLAAMGADLTRIRIVKGVYNSNGETAVFSIAENLPELRAHLTKYPQTALILIDPIAAFLGDRDDGLIETRVRRSLSPVRELAEEFKVAILGIMHFKKSPESNAMYQIGGSVGFVAQARAIFTTIKEKNSDRFLFLPAGSNLSKGDHGYAYRIEEVVITAEEGPIVTTKIVWDGRVEGTADDAMQEQRETKGEAAKTWLTERLSDGPVLMKTLKKEVEALGGAFSWGSVEKVADDIVQKSRTGFAGSSVWQLIRPEQKDAG